MNPMSLHLILAPLQTVIFLSIGGRLTSYTVPKVDGKFRYTERMALVQSNMERIFPLTYFPSREGKFLLLTEFFTHQNKFFGLCN